MKRNTETTTRQGGFTLIEVVVSILITAVLASLLVTMTGNPLTRSTDPVLALKHAYGLQKIMESMAAFTNGVDALSANIGAEGATNAYPNAFGASYEVVNNRFISFVGGIETSGGTNNLKVTIQNESGDRLTRIFCRK